MACELTFGFPSATPTVDQREGGDIENAVITTLTVVQRPDK